MYKVNLKKIARNCSEVNNKKFGSTNFSKGSSPHLIHIDEGEYNHFVQILFMIKEKSYKNNKWINFTRDDLMNIIYDDIEIYVDPDNRSIWGNTFIYKFEVMADKFIEEFCIKTN